VLVSHFVSTQQDLRARETKIEDLYPTIARHEHVIRLEIAVDDAAIVRSTEALRDLNGVLDGPPDRRRTRVQDLAHGAAFEQLSHGVDNAVRSAEVEDRENVRVRNRCEALGFASEPPQSYRIV